MNLVPARRLSWAVLALGVPLALAYAAAPGLAPLLVLAVAIAAVVAALDAFWGAEQLDALTVDLPRPVRLTQEREAALPFRITNARPAPRALRVRLGTLLPVELHSRLGGLHEAVEVILPPGAEAVEAPWPVWPTLRGRYGVPAAWIERPSPMGLWLRRRRVPLEGELRVYPNLSSERKQLAALFLHRTQLGLHMQRQVGKGRDFEQLREYLPGDSFEDIHWKATARRGEPITKMYQVERTQDIYVVIDTSRLSMRKVAAGEGLPGEPPPPDASTEDEDGEGEGDGGARPREVPQVDRFILAALVLALVAEQQGDRFGLAAFGERMARFVPAGSGRAHFNTCRDALYTLQAAPVEPDFDELFAFLRTRIHRRSLLIVLTNLDDPVVAEQFVSASRLVERHHLMLVNMITPAGVEPVFSRHDVRDVGGIYRSLCGHLQWRELREVQQTLRTHGVRMQTVANAALSPELVSQYLNVKQRQLL